MQTGQFRQFNAAGAASRSGRRNQNSAANQAAQMAREQQQREAQRAAEMAQAVAAADMAKRRSRKPTDKDLPEGIENCLPDAELAAHYNSLRGYEKRLDAMITRKRLDVLEDVNRQPKHARTLRIWISNTVEEQPWQQANLNVDSFDFSSSVASTYKVKIQAQLLPDEHNLNNPEENDNDSKLHFPDFFKSMSVEYPTPQAPDQPVEWKRPDIMPNMPPGAPQLDALNFDEITFRRNGDDNINIVIHLLRYEETERYAVSPELSDVTGLTDGTRLEIVRSLYEYINSQNLQEDEERRHFRCDDALRKVVKRDMGTIPSLQEYILPHLSPMPPISLPYTIRVDKAFHDNPTPTIYDVRVMIDSPIKSQLYRFISDPSYSSMLRDVVGLDDNLAKIVQAILVSKAKRTFFVSLANDPVGFLRKWLSSQQRDLEVISGQTVRGVSGTGAETWRKGGKDSVWATEAAQESVSMLLSKQPRLR